MIEPTFRESYIFPLDNWGKKEKLNWLMEEYGDRVLKLAITYVRSKQIAEDITRDVILKCYENLDTFRGEASYKTWLYRITVNKCKYYLKSWSHRNLFFTEFISTFHQSSYSSADEEFLVMEENRILSETILSLPVKYREMIILYYKERMSLVEISDLLGLNINTIKSRLTRARKLLHKKLKGGNLFG